MTRQEFDDEINDWPDLINFCNDNGLEDYVSDLVDSDTLDEMVKSEAEGGWQRVSYFLAGIQSMTSDYYRINGYGNAEDADSDDFASCKSDVANAADFDTETKYGYMNGNAGYMPDYNSGYVYDSQEEAAESAADALELTDEEKAELITDGLIYLKGERAHEVGAGLVEIIESDDPDEIAASMDN
jgi:hypothetical protein